MVPVAILVAIGQALECKRVAETAAVGVSSDSSNYILVFGAKDHILPHKLLQLPSSPLTGLVY